MVQCSKFLVFVGVLAIAAVGGCAATEADKCVLDEDCASGHCRVDGSCAPDVDASSNPTDGASDGPIALCTPNHDGSITRAEFPLEPGRTATYRVGLDVDVNTAGLAGPNQTRVWDFSNQNAGDQEVQSALQAVAGTWYASAFPGATYATRLSQTEPLNGVFELTDAGLLLRGVVSDLGGATRTELVYEPPVTVVKFPLQSNTSWSTTSTITGVAQGVPSVYTEEYSSIVDAVGELTTPFGTFPVQRIRIDLTRTVGVLITTSRSFSFISECFTSVANVRSEDYESDIDFDRAAELRRLSL